MNTAAFDINRFYKRAQTDGLVSHQFANLTAVAQYNLVYRTTLKYIRAGDQALDWGAGSGHFAYFLLDRGLAVTTFSFSPDTPDVLRARDRLTHITGDVSEPVALPFRDETFDHVFSIGVLEHVHETGGEQLASMLEIKRILKPGGTFLCFHFPNKYGWIEPAKKKLMPQAHEHSRKFSSSEIIELCHAAGLDLLEIGRYNFLPRNEVAKVMGAISNTRIGAATFNGLDWLLTRLMPRFATNYFFVVRTPC